MASPDNPAEKVDAFILPRVDTMRSRYISSASSEKQRKQRAQGSSSPPAARSTGYEGRTQPYN